MPCWSTGYPIFGNQTACQITVYSVCILCLYPPTILYIKIWINQMNSMNSYEFYVNIIGFLFMLVLTESY